MPYEVSSSADALGMGELLGVFDAIEAGCCVIEILYDAFGRPIDHRYLAVNPAFELHTGLVGAEGKRARELIPSFESHWDDAYDTVAKTGVPTRVTREVRGLGRWFEVSASRLGGPGSHKLALLFEDVTAKKAASDAFADAQTRLAATLAAGEVATWTWDVVRDEVVGDRNLARIFGVPEERAASASVTVYYDRIHPEDRPRVEAMIDSAIANGTGYEAEYRIVRTPDDTRWVIARGKVECDDTGASARLPGVVLDITSQRAAEHALRLAETRLHLALRAGHMGTWELDLGSSTLQHCSGVFKANFGREPDEPFTYEDFVDGFHESSRHGVLQALAEAGKAPRQDGDGSSVELEAQVVWPDGTLHWLHLRAEASGSADARVLSGVTVLIDARRRTEELLLQAAQRKDEFLATASHELRTPLNAILGWARMLRAGTLDPSAARRGIEVIERNALAQVRLIEDILDGSRLISGKLRLEVGPVDFGALVSSALEAVRAAADAKQIELTVDVEAAAAHLTGDADRLQQIVWNLVNNAIKFTPKGGQVHVRLARVSSHIDLTVRDTGQGIPAAFLPHVFERFRQLEAATTRRHGGLGLGLALVRHLAEAHGGTVRAESEGEGRGATFTVSLPVRAIYSRPPSPEPTSARPAVDALVASGALDGVRVLVVDDETDARELVATVLRTSGAEVTLAASAEQALGALETAAPMVVVSDIGMPVVDGYELIRRIRQDVGSQVPALALTAYAGAEDRRLAIEAGFHSHLTKPVEPSELLRIVASLVRPADRASTRAGHLGIGRADPLTKLERVLAKQGIHAALGFLNSRTPHRFTGLYRFDPPNLTNLFLVDAEAPELERGTHSPLVETYCSIVGDTGDAFTTEDTRRDDRLRTHPARDAVISYCGVLLRAADGRPYGTLCHFDLVPSEVAVRELPLMEAAAPLLMTALGASGLL